MLANPIILQRKYSRIVEMFAVLCDISLDDALSFFYNSNEYGLLHDGVADIHCMSDEYIAEDLALEYKIRTSAINKMVYNYIKKNPDTSNNAIENETGEDGVAILKAINELQDGGYIKYANIKALDGKTNSSLGFVTTNKPFEIEL